MYIDEPLYYYRNHSNGISSFSNTEKAYAWSLQARLDACNRRGLSIEEVLPNAIKSEDFVKNYYENTLEVKIGRSILKPIRFIQNILKI